MFQTQTAAVPYPMRPLGHRTLPGLVMNAGIRWPAPNRTSLRTYARSNFILELMSDSDEKYTLPRKMEKYLQNGVRLAWMIDPFGQQTEIYRPDTAPDTRPFTETLRGEDVLPGFELRLSEIV